MMSRRFLCLIPVVLTVLAACGWGETAVDSNLNQQALIDRYLAEPEATPVLAPYQARRDQIAALQCTGAYSLLTFNMQRDRRLPIARYEAFTLRAAKGVLRTRTLTSTSAIPREEFLRINAWMVRHGFKGERFGDATDQERDAFLEGLEPHLDACDKALDAWGARPMTDSEARKALDPLTIQRLEERRQAQPPKPAP